MNLSTFKILCSIFLFLLKDVVNFHRNQSMSYRDHKVQIIARNEGKIKSYDSCTDVRAWSHDLQTRNYYLRDWMRSDMPICIIPTYTVTEFLTNMTRRNPAKLTPRCRPDCKSKLILETVCASCHAIRECLMNDETIEKYFQDEELHTSHWPCDRCLNALKSIKMFWQIILDKIFGINIPNQYPSSDICSSVRSIAKSYLEEINDQTIYLRKILAEKDKCENYENKTDTIRFKIYSNDFVTLTPKESTHRILVVEKCIETESIESLKKKKYNEKVSQGVSIKWETANCGCNTCDVKAEGIESYKKNVDLPREQRNSQNVELYKETKVDCGCETCDFKDEVIKSYKRNINCLQERLDSQNVELAKATKENISLKLELQQIYRTNTWNSYHNQPNFAPFQEVLENIPLPFESIDEDDNFIPQSIDSEIIITLKNCKNEAFKNISLLQVIHKSNTAKEMNEHCCHKDDPIKLLTKVQNTFDNIVQREIDVVTEKCVRKDKTIINSSYAKVESAETAQSAHSTLPSHSISSGTVFNVLNLWALLELTYVGSLGVVSRFENIFPSLVRRV